MNRKQQAAIRPEPEKTAWKDDGKRRAFGRFLPILIVAAGLLFGYAMGWQEFLTLDYVAASREMLKAEVAEGFWLAVLIYISIYTLATAFSFPAASLLTISGGFLFGWIIGGIAAVIGATLGATLIFIAARSAFHDFLMHKVGGRAEKLAKGFEENAFQYLLILRLAPVFPFFVMNIAPALFNVPLRTYVAATFFGIIPGGMAYAYLGQGLDRVVAAAAKAGEEISVRDVVTTEILIAFGLLALVAAIPAVVKKLRGGTIA